MIEIEIPQRVAEVADLEQRRFTVQGANVAESVAALCSAHSELAPYLLDAAACLKPNIRAFVEQVSAEPETIVTAGQRITLLIDQSGGAPRST